MKYTQPSFSVPPADLRNGTNRHGQTWDDIWNPPLTLDEFLNHPPLCPCGTCVQFRKDTPDFPLDFVESIPDATGDSLSHSADKTGHMCNGTYKTFSAEHCPYCWSEHAR